MDYRKVARTALKIVHVLNMANDAYAIILALRKNGFESDLIINSADFGMGLPMWEDLEIDMDPYDVDFDKLLEQYDLPSWMKIWRTKTARSSLHKITELFRLVEGYDYLHCHAPSSMYLQFTGKPFIVHEAGWIRRLTTEHSNTERLGRRSYAKADCVVMTNPDTYPMLHRLDYKREIFIPFVIDPEKYKPLDVEKETDELLFFNPARQHWVIKGNHKLIRGFSKYIEAGYRAKLRLVAWGPPEDLQNSRDLVSALNLTDHVEWVKPYSKPGLIRAYSESDAIFDQFILGSGGTACFEALSCGKPLAIFLNDWNITCFGEMPPVGNCYTPDQIFKTMVDFTDPVYREKLGCRGRRFVQEHNSPDVVAKQFIELYEEIFQ